jgi:hypothetical protein
MKCEVCGRDRAEDQGVRLALTAEDRRLISNSTGQPAPAEYFYCKPCYGVLTDREQGARLISGQIESRLRLAGHPKAQQIAEKVYTFLIEKSSSKQVS